MKNMNMTFDLAKIEEMMRQQARKQLETELETTCCSPGGVRCLYTAVLVSPVQASLVQSSPVHSPVQSSPESGFYRDPILKVIQWQERVLKDMKKSVCTEILRI